MYSIIGKNFLTGKKISKEEINIHSFIIAQKKDKFQKVVRNTDTK